MTIEDFNGKFLDFTDFVPVRLRSALLHVQELVNLVLIDSP